MKITLEYQSSTAGWWADDFGIWLCHAEVRPLFKPPTTEPLCLYVTGKPQKKRGEVKLSFGYRRIMGVYSRLLPSAIVSGRMIEIGSNAYNFAARKWGKRKRVFDVYVRKV